jgi:hypothetical protein
MPPEEAKHYGYTPRPPETIPPLGEEYLLHRFHTPHDGQEDVLCLEQLPKRLKKKPERGKTPDNYTAWGVQFVEGPYFTKIYTCLAVMLGGGSLLFGVLYWSIKRDIQGAFTVAGYVCGIESLLLHLWQLWALKP